MIRAMTLAVAVAALVLSVISLAFTAYQWRRSGPALVVKLMGLPIFGLHVEVVSSGRLPVTVRMVQLELTFSNGNHTYLPMDNFSHDLPATLAPTDVLVASLQPPSFTRDGLASLDGPYRNVESVTAMARSGMRWMRSQPLANGKWPNFVPMEMAGKSPWRRWVSTARRRKRGLGRR
jgi:hypothetical protein